MEECILGEIFVLLVSMFKNYIEEVIFEGELVVIEDLEFVVVELIELMNMIVGK